MRCDIAGSYNAGFRFLYTVDCSLTDCITGYSVDDWCTGINIFYNEKTTIARNVFQVIGVEGFENADCLIVDNSVEGSHYVGAPGFSFSDSHNFTISGNELHEVETGIVFGHGSTNGTIFNNRIHDNRDYGLRLYPACRGFRIYNNSFWNNEKANAIDDGFSNSWDDGISLGNQWDDYGGVGIYNISGSAESVDNFPRSYSYNTPTTTTSPIDITSTTSTPSPPDTLDGFLTIVISGAVAIGAVIIFVIVRKR
jgi:parallel beta-helix repeat protein